MLPAGKHRGNLGSTRAFAGGALHVSSKSGTKGHQQNNRWMEMSLSLLERLDFYSHRFMHPQNFNSRGWRSDRRRLRPLGLMACSHGRPTRCYSAIPRCHHIGYFSRRGEPGNPLIRSYPWANVHALGADVVRGSRTETVWRKASGGPRWRPTSRVFASPSCLTRRMASC